MSKNEHTLDLLLVVLFQHVLHLLPALHVDIFPYHHPLLLLLLHTIFLLHELVDPCLSLGIVGALLGIGKHLVKPYTMEGVPLLCELEFPDQA